MVYNILNAHASAVQVFRQLCPQGFITSNFAVEWVVPLNGTAANQVQHLLAFYPPGTVVILQHRGQQNLFAGASFQLME